MTDVSLVTMVMPLNFQEVNAKVSDSVLSHFLVSVSHGFNNIHSGVQPWSMYTNTVNLIVLFALSTECGCYPQGTYRRGGVDDTGLIECDAVSGECACQFNVVGRQCDQCIEGYWNIDSGNGQLLKIY